MFNQIPRLSSYALFALFALALGLGGCANGPTAQGMTVKTADVKPAAPEVASSLEIQDVTGGEESDSWATSISNADFKSALIASMSSASLLSTANAARFKVRVTLVSLDLDQRFLGVDMKVTASVRYVVVDAKSGAGIMNEVITTAFTGELRHSAIGTTSLRLACEGAARKNLAGFIEKVNATKLGAGSEKTASR